MKSVASSDDKNSDVQHEPAARLGAWGPIAAGVLGVLLLASAAAGCKRGRGQSGGAPDAAAQPQTWKCLGTEDEVTRVCSVGAGCALMGKAILCPSHYADLRASGRINNWKKSGKWTPLQGKVGLISLGNLEQDKDKAGCMVADRDADVHLCGAPAGNDFLGLVHLDRYDEGLVSDDLWLTAVAPEATAENLRTAFKIGEALRRATATDARASDKLGLLDAVTAPSDDTTKRLYAEVLTAEAFDLAALAAQEPTLRAELNKEKAAALEEQKEEAEKRRKALADDPFERMWAVSEPLSELDDDAWAVPPRGACGTEPKGDEFERRKLEATRVDHVRALPRRLFKLSVTSEKSGDYNFAGHVQKLKLDTRDHFALGSGPLVKSETVMQAVCCNVLTGNCRQADGFLTARCESAAEELRESPVGTNTSFSETAKETVISVPQKPDDAERLKNATWSAVVIVVVSSATRLCNDDKSLRETLFSGRIVGLRLTAAGDVVQRKADVAVTVEQAEQGPAAWRKSK
jgi:hypothetical protein